MAATLPAPLLPTARSFSAVARRKALQRVLLPTLLLSAGVIVLKPDNVIFSQVFPILNLNQD